MSGADAILRQLRHEVQMLTADLHRAKQELAAERARTAAFASQLEEALHRLAELEGPASPALAHAAADAELALRAEVAALLHHREEARRLRASTSWRITRPLRALSRPGHTLRTLLRRPE